MDIAATATSMHAAQIGYQASVAVLENTMDSMEQIAALLTEQMLNLNVGTQAASALDTYI